VSSDQLSSAAVAASTSQNGSARDSPDRAGTRSSPPVLNKKTGIEYWENFPLDTVDNIRRWQQDCAMHTHFKEEGNHRSSGSRPTSVEITTDSLHSRKSSSTNHQYRSMSSDSYSGANGYNGITQSRYNSIPATQSYSMHVQAPYSNGDHWQAQTAQVHQNGLQPHMSHHTIHHPQHQQQIPVAASGPMEVDTNGTFFSGEVKRHLFW
jgi:hypothetical protein